MKAHATNSDRPRPNVAPDEPTPLTVWVLTAAFLGLAAAIGFVALYFLVER